MPLYTGCDVITPFHSTACSVSELRSEVKPSAEDVIRCYLFSTARDRWYGGQWWTGGGRGVGRVLRQEPASVSHFVSGKCHMTAFSVEPETARSEALSCGMTWSGIVVVVECAVLKLCTKHCRHTVQSDLELS
jgi:hypothetical protein